VAPHPLPVLLAVAVAGCSQREPGRKQPARPLADAILGAWEVWCRTDQEPTATCLGREDAGLFKIFRAGGQLTAGARGGTSLDGRWTLDGDRLALAFTGGGLSLREEYRARIQDDRLILWNAEQGWGAIHGREGAPFRAAASPVSDGAPIAGELGGVRYSLRLPAGYRLTRDDNRRRRYGPASGRGLVVALTVSPRGQTEVDGRWATPPCNDRDWGGVVGSSEAVDGVERDTSIGRSWCVDGTDRVLWCSAEHTRGYLEPGEKAAALALCESLDLAR
jgi:hypothetical protein